MEDNESSMTENAMSDELLRNSHVIATIAQAQSVQETNIRESMSWAHASKIKFIESMDFEEVESVMWRKHQLRRFFQDRGTWWTTSRRSTAWKWVLVIVTGGLIGLIGCFVEYATNLLSGIKFDYTFAKMQTSQGMAYITFLVFCLVYACLAGILCWIEPRAAGGGIPELKAYLNGINLNKFVRIKVLICKVLGMCLSCSANLPIGKEAPMIHAGAIVGAAVSQGRSLTFGFDTSWTKFQDLRNERSKRDFVTFGAAAGVAAAFSAPIGGILFTLEEGASFWSTTVTFRAFFCAMITQLTIQLVSGGASLGKTAQAGIFTFGTFNTPTLFAYEMLFFILMGVMGGVMGGVFNNMNKAATLLRKKYVNTHKWKRLVELMCITAVFATLCFVIPLMWGQCTPLPTDTATWSPYQQQMLGELVQFNCPANEYNMVASLYLVEAQVAMQQLFHFQESNGSNYPTFDSGSLLLFFVPYFIAAAVTAGCFCPAGLFVPTLLAGAAYGRLIGHILNCAVPGRVSDSGTYALIGAAAILGGMSRMTIAGTVIILEASGNPSLLLPLMLTFAAARYSGNAFTLPMYDMHIELNQLPFLEGSLKTLGLLNYHPVNEIMAQPVVSVQEVSRVGTLYEMLKAMDHNGFPVLSKQGHMRGMILRKTLCSLLKLKVFSSFEKVELIDENGDMVSRMQFVPVSVAFHETLEKNYPHYPKIQDIVLTKDDLECWVDVRAYMDTAPFTINESCSIQRAYRFFRSMGLRHLMVVNEDHVVTGIITRHDLTEHRLEHHWFQEGDKLQQFMEVGPNETDFGTSFFDASSRSPSHLYPQKSVYKPPVLYDKSSNIEPVPGIVSTSPHKFSHQPSFLSSSSSSYGDSLSSNASRLPGTGAEDVDVAVVWPMSATRGMTSGQRLNKEPKSIRSTK